MTQHDVSRFSMTDLLLSWLLAFHDMTLVALCSILCTFLALPLNLPPLLPRVVLLCFFARVTEVSVLLLLAAMSPAAALLLLRCTDDAGLTLNVHVGHDDPIMV